MFESAADEHINELIEELCERASRTFCESHERKELIDQIAQLRASQNPLVRLIHTR
jgi:hypothetical protein